MVFQLIFALVIAAFCPTIAEAISLEQIRELGTQIKASDMTYNRYREVATLLTALKPEFMKMYQAQCPEGRAPTERVSDEIEANGNSSYPTRDQLWKMISAVAVENGASRNVAESTRPSGLEQYRKGVQSQDVNAKQDRCRDLKHLYDDLFGSNRIFNTKKTHAEFIEQYQINACTNSSYREYLRNRHYNFESTGCKQQAATVPACFANSGMDLTVASIAQQKTAFGMRAALAREATRALKEMIHQQIPVFRNVIQVAESDLETLNAEMTRVREKLLETRSGDSVDRDVNRMSIHYGHPYVERLKSRTKLVELSRDYFWQLDAPADPDDRMQELIRYSPEIVDQLMGKLESLVTCDPKAKAIFNEMSVKVCSAYNHAKDRRDFDQDLVEGLGILQDLSFLGATVTANPGSAPLSGALLAGSVSLGVGKDLYRGLRESDFYSNRAVAAAVLGGDEGMSTAIDYLALREKVRDQMVKDLAWDVLSAVPVAAAGLSAKAALNRRFLDGMARLGKVNPKLEGTLASISENLTWAKRKAIQMAHEVGGGSRLANRPYTLVELRKKAQILEKAGYTAIERRALLESGVCGVANRVAAAGAAKRSDSLLDDVIQLTDDQNKAARVAQDLAESKSVSNRFSLAESEARLAKLEADPNAHPLDKMLLRDEVEALKRKAQELVSKDEQIKGAKILDQMLKENPTGIIHESQVALPGRPVPVDEVFDMNPSILDQVIANGVSRESARGPSQQWIQDILRDQSENVAKIKAWQTELDQIYKAGGPEALVDSRAIELRNHIDELEYSLVPYSDYERLQMKAYIADIRAEQTTLGKGQKKAQAEIESLLSKKKLYLPSEDAELVRRFEAAKAVPEKNYEKSLDHASYQLQKLNGNVSFSEVRTPHITQARKSLPGMTDNDLKLLDQAMKKDPRGARFSWDERRVLEKVWNLPAGDAGDSGRQFFTERARYYRTILEQRASH